MPPQENCQKVKIMLDDNQRCCSGPWPFRVVDGGKNWPKIWLREKFQRLLRQKMTYKTMISLFIVIYKLISSKKLLI